MQASGRGWTRWGTWTMLAALAVCVAVAAPLLTRNIGYLFEADFPWMLEIPRSLEWDGEPGPSAPVRWTHDPEEAGRVFSGTWWPRLSVRVGDDALPVVTEAYQGGGPYWPFHLLARESRTLDAVRWLAGVLGGLTLLLSFLALRAWWGRKQALLLTALLAFNSMFLLSFGFGYLYEALPMSAVLATAWLAGGVRKRPTATGALFVGVLAGAAGGFKLTALPAAAVVAAVLLGTEVLRHRWRACAFLAGLAIPPLKFLFRELAAVTCGAPSPLLSALSSGKGVFSDPSGLTTGLREAGAWMFSLPAGNSHVVPMLAEGISPPWWLPALSAAVALPGLALGVWQWRKGRSDPLRDAILAGWGLTFALSVLLYRSGFDFQAFMTVHPLAASLVVRGLLGNGEDRDGEGRESWGARWRGLRWAARGGVAAFGAVVVLQTVLAFAGSGAVSTVASRKAQEEIAAAVPEGRPVVTTSYNQAGMLRMMSRGRVEEINMDRQLSPGGDERFYRLTVRHAFSETIRGYPEALYLFDLAPLPIDESREHTRFDRGLTSRHVVAEEFVQAARDAGLYSRAKVVSHGDTEWAVYALVELVAAPAADAGFEAPASPRPPAPPQGEGRP